MPRCGQRPAPLDPLDIDRVTLREVTGVMAERLGQLDAFGHCPTGGDAEARAFLDRLRGLLTTIERGAEEQ